MKICYVTKGNINSTAAAAINITSMCDAFARNGHDVHLITPYFKDEDFDQEDYFNRMGVNSTFTIHRIRITDVKFFRSISFMLKASQRANRLKPDIFYVRFTLDYVFVPLLKGKVIIESHNPPQKGGIRSWFQKRTLSSERVRKLVLITERLKSLYIPLGKQIVDKITVAADAANIPKPEISSCQFALKGKSDFNIGYVGHLYKGRGIELIYSLSQKLPSIQFHILGGGEKDVSDWKNKTEKAKNIHFYGHAAHVEVPAFASKMDLLLAPYEHSVSVKGGGNTVMWMSPLKIFEYMSFGKAFICSDLPVLREVLIDGYNCILCPTDEEVAWENAIKELYKNESLRYELGTKALNDLRKNYTWSGRIVKILSSID